MRMGPQGPLSSPRVLHSEVRGTGMHRNLFVTLPERIAACCDAFLAIATIHIWAQRLLVG
jgi:hypothetical protein